MDLSLPFFTLFSSSFCMKWIEFATRTYNFKNLAVGTLIWSAKTGVNSPYFLKKISTCHVLCCILALLASRVDLAYSEFLYFVNKINVIFLVDLVAYFFLELY